MRAALLWNTYGGDLPWFEHSARSYAKYARGFEWAKCVVPNPAVESFRPHCDANGIQLVGFDEWPDKGFNHHMAMQCMGDLHFPDAEVIFHIDADCVFASSCTPDKWLPSGQVLLPFTDFSKFLTRPVDPNEEATFMGFTGLRMDFNRGQYFWKFASDYALGWSVERETMAWMPIAHIREVYPKLRDIVSKRFKRPFEEYVKTCRNEWPQTFCEFNALGAVAHRFFEDRYHWNNISTHGYPFSGIVEQCWSHGGFDRPHGFSNAVGGHQTPRQLFERLGV